MRKFLKMIRNLMIVGVILSLFGGLTVLVAPRVYSALRAGGAIYDLDTVPERPVAIVFGAQIFGDGRLSAMLADRVKMGAELYLAGKVKALLLTGDNSQVEYNEPEAMRQYALRYGVPDESIVLDYAGFRTYDSCYRARDIFKVDAAVLVTQRYHLDRALLTCSGLGIDAVGVAADVLRPNGYSSRAMISGQIREFPATALTVFDLLRGKKPYYLGEPLPIFTEDRSRASA